MSDGYRSESAVSALHSPTNRTPLLSVTGLRIQTVGSHADVVDEVSFTLDRGEILGLVGESGSGKTTVALALMGHARKGLEISRGQVLFDGDDVLKMGAELRKLRGARIAYVAQDPASALQSTLRIGTQLREIFKAHGTGMLGGQTVDERITQLLAEVGLERVVHVLEAFPHQLSGGQQQRVMLAMAFACRPDLIILDEPTTGLDVTTQRVVLDTIRELCNRYSVAAVYVSHDLAVVGELVDRVGVMYAGRLVEEGSTSSVFNKPSHPYTRALLRAIPSTTRAHVLIGLDGQPPRPGHRPQGCFFAPRCEFATDVCRQSMPDYELLGDDQRRVRCWRATEVVRLPPPGELPERTRTNSEPGENALLKVDGLAASYANRRVLNDISFSVEPRQCLAIVGESGAGKSTLARCIVGLHGGWSGEVTFGGAPLGQDRRRRSRDSRQRMQYIFQNPYNSLNPRKTVAQLIEQPLKEMSSLSRADRASRVAAALEDAALSQEYSARYPGELSGGERQRVAIARALVIEPELLVCDEVTSALDVSVQAAIVELLDELKRTRGVAVVLITHNLALVRSLADDVLILRDGQIVEHGPSVLDQPESEYAVTLLENVPTLDLTV